MNDHGSTTPPAPDAPRVHLLRGRRRFVREAASLLALAPVGGLACGTNGGPSGDAGGTTEPATDSSTEGPGGTTACCTTSTGATTGASSGGDSTGDIATTDAATTANDSGSSTGDASSTGDGVTCELTDEDIEGPFYREGIPIGGNLDVHGDTGMPLILHGTVLDTGCRPLANAVVEIWHATPVAPGGEPGDDDATYDATAEYRYYGQVATDASGAFEFTTLRPGWYLNGASYRPAHVHLKVWVGGVERLTTQLYFVGDPFNASDPWFNPQLALDPSQTGDVDLELVV